MPALQFSKIEIYVGNPHACSIILTITSQIYNKPRGGAYLISNVFEGANRGRGAKQREGG